MGSIAQKAMRKLGVNETFIKKIFQSAQDRMLQAIMAGDLVTVELLHTQQKFDFGELTDDFENCLHVAVKYNQLDIAKYIIQSYVNFNEQFHILEDKNMQGDSPLMVAILAKNLDMTQYLVREAGARVRCTLCYREGSPWERGRHHFHGCVCHWQPRHREVHLRSAGQLLLQKQRRTECAPQGLLFWWDLGCSLPPQEHQSIHKPTLSVQLQILSKDKHGNNCFHLASKRLNLTLIRYLLKKFRRQSTILAIPNGENQTFIQILCRIFNSIRETGFE